MQKNVHRLRIAPLPGDRYGRTAPLQRWLKSHCLALPPPVKPLDAPMAGENLPPRPLNGPAPAPIRSGPFVVGAAPGFTERLPELIGNAPCMLESEPPRAAGGAAHDAGADRRADGLGQGTGGRGAAPACRRAAASRLWPSIARRFPRRCSRPSSSATRAARLPARCRAAPGASKRRRRHAVSGRDRRDAAGAAIEAAALCGVRRAAAGGRQRDGEGGCAHHRRHAPAAGAAGAETAASAPIFTTGWRSF